MGDIEARAVQNAVVSVEAWELQEDVYADYPFKAAIPIANITGADLPIVVFAPEDATGGSFSPVAFSFDGCVEIFAKFAPTAEIIVPMITYIVLDSTVAVTDGSTKGLTNANGVATKTLAFRNVSVDTTAWEIEENPIYEDFPVSGTVMLSGVTSRHYCEVVLNVTDALEGNFAPVTQSFDGGIYLYAAKAPTETMTIPTIICTPVEVST